MKKIYRITFNEYTNALRDTIYNEDEDRYLDIPDLFLIKEGDVQFFQGYGGGIKEMKFVGELYENA